MSKLKRALMQASLGASGGAAEATYVDDVFSTYLYEGDGANRVIQNDIKLGNTTTGGSVYFPQGPLGVFNNGSDNVYPVQLSSNITLSSDFTIEMWINRDGTQPYGECILSPDYGVTSSNIQIGINNSEILPVSQRNVMYIYDGSGKYGSTSVTVPPKGWFHIAYSRSGSTLYFWVNGVAAGSVTTSHSFVINTIGALGGYGGGPVGYISNLRISDNARYTTAFTPPTSALSTDVNTLLLTFQGDFVDQTGNRTLTVNGSTAASTEGPFDSGTGGKGGLIWLKKRTSGTPGLSHSLLDTERGTDVRLKSDTSDADLSFDQLTSFNSDGFTISGTGAKANGAGEDYVSWTFRKQPGFFDIVTYTGDGSTNKTISHNLGSTPGMIIVKCTSASYRWNVWHRGLTNATTNSNPSLTNMVFLNNTDAESLTSSGGIADVNDSTFDVGGVFANDTGETFIAYLFAHDAQDFGTGSDEAIIKCGSYTGTATIGSPTVDLGFEPQFVLVKRIDSTSNWFIQDNMRSVNTTSTDMLFPNLNNAATTGSYASIVPTATGFYIGDNGTNYNASGGNYIYVAIRRPHKPAEEFAATDLFAIDTRNSTGDGLEPGFRSGFPVDMNIFNPNVTQANAHRISSRLTGNKYLESSSTNAEQTGSTTLFDYMNGWLASGATASDAYSWMFRRAPGFFDVVAYTGTGTAGLSINHNLGVTPEMMIVKRRNASQGWAVYHHDANASPATGACQLESNIPFTVSSVYWNDTAPTDTVFTLGSSNITNNNNDTYIAYLFATVSGISKVGGYTGTASDLDIDCGFTSGARFVLIKRASAAEDWYLWDSERGIVAGNDPFLILNSSAAQLGIYDRIDPLSSGFTVTSSAGPNINNAGDTYIFLAIA